MEQQLSPNLFDLNIDNQTTAYLSETARWAKFLSIIGFILCGLMVIVALFLGSFIASTMQTIQGGSSVFGGGVFTVIYLLFALIFFFPCLYLFHFSTKMQTALKTNDQVQLNTSFGNLKSCFKFMGIYTIIMLSLYALGILIAIGAAASGLGS